MDIKTEFKKDDNVYKAQPHNTVIKVNDDGTIRFRLITPALDSYSEVVRPEGARHDRIKTNFPWLWVHNMEAWGGMIRPPIGRGMYKSIEQNKEHFDVDVLFDEKNDEFAKLIANKHRDDFLRGCSVGFYPVVISKDPDQTGQKGVTHLEYIMLEGSSVPIGSNPESLQQKEWSEFIEACEKYGFTLGNMKTYCKVAGWSEEEIREAIPSGLVKMTVPEIPAIEKFDDEIMGGAAENMARLLGVCGECKAENPEEIYNELIKVYKSQGKEYPQYSTCSAPEAAFIMDSIEGNDIQAEKALSMAGLAIEWLDTIKVLQGRGFKNLVNDNMISVKSEPFDQRKLIAEIRQRIVFLKAECGEFAASDKQLLFESAQILADMVKQVDSDSELLIVMQETKNILSGRKPYENGLIKELKQINTTILKP